MEEFIKDQLWMKSYPVRYSGARFDARMTVISLNDGGLALHSPCEIDAATKAEIQALGTVCCIIAPGTFHWLHIGSAQAAFPDAETFICPGIERKNPEIVFDWFLSDHAPSAWDGLMEQVLVRGNRFMWEVAFFHKSSKTLLLVDLLENFTDNTPDTSLGLKLWWKGVFGMWNHPKPAPEYQLGWSDKKAAKLTLEKILQWNFERVIIAHGDNISSNARAVVEKAWSVPLGWKL